MSKPDDLGLIEFEQASAMERHFLDGRIRLLYYLYAFFIGSLTLGAAMIRSNSAPTESAILLAVAGLVAALLSILSLLSWQTIRNWNLALDRYAAWKLRVQEETYGAKAARERMHEMMPEPVSVLSDPSRQSVELPALLLCLLGFAASVLSSAFAARLDPSAVLVSSAAPALVVLSVVLMLAPPGRVKTALLAPK